MGERRTEALPRDYAETARNFLRSIDVESIDQAAALATMLAAAHNAGIAEWQTTASVGTDGGTVEGDSDSAQRRGPSGRDCDRAEQAGRSGPQARPAMPMPPRRCTEPEHCPSEAPLCARCGDTGRITIIDDDGAATAVPFAGCHVCGRKATDAAQRTNEPLVEAHLRGRVRKEISKFCDANDIHPDNIFALVELFEELRGQRSETALRFATQTEADALLRLIDAAKAVVDGADPHCGIDDIVRADLIRALRKEVEALSVPTGSNGDGV